MVRSKIIKMLSKNKGFSLLGSLLGFSLLGLSTVGLATYMGNFEQAQVQYSEQSDVLFKHKSLLETMRSMLIGIQVEVDSSSVGTVQDFKKYGICGLVGTALNYNDIKGEFTCPIEIKKSKILDGSSLGFTDTRWNYFLKVIGNKEWQISSGDCANGSNGFFGDFTENHFNKCLKASRSAGGYIYARLTMIPTQMPAFTEIEQANSDTVPVGFLVYKLKSVISMPNKITTDSSQESTYAVSKSEKLVLSSEVLECHICDGGPGACSLSTQNYMLARLSTSSLGSSTSEGKICYHSNIKGPGICSALSVDYVSKNILQAGQIENTGNPKNVVLGSDTIQNVAASCSLNVFRCANDSKRFDDDEFFDSSIRMTYGLYLDTFLKSTNIDSLDFRIGPWTVAALHGDGSGSSRVGRDRIGLKTFDKNHNFWHLQAGGTEVTSYVSVKNGSQNICKNICEQPNYYSPSISVEYNDITSKGSKKCSKNINFGSSPYNVKMQCTVCHMKNCHRYGVGTFGKVATLPDEPLDGSVPECVIHKDYEQNTNSFTLVGSYYIYQSRRCVKRMSPTEFKPVLCGNSDVGTDYRSVDFEYTAGSKKTLCFVNGKSKIVTGGASGLDAQLNCLAPLSEVQKLGSPSQEGVWTNGLLPSLAIAYNLPPESIDATDASVRKTLEDAGLTVETENNVEVIKFKNSVNMATNFGDSFDESSSENHVWVNIQRDASGMFHEGWPSMMKGGDWAFFYREPFEGIKYTDLSTASLPSGVTIRDIQSRMRPARPIYIKTDSNFHADRNAGGNNNDETSGISTAGASANMQALLLTHHLQYRGLRGVGSSTSRSFPYLCRKVGATKIKDIFKLSQTKGTSLTPGHQACRNLGSNWFFIPPDSRELWAAALQTVAPNAPRYSFPNPFKFVDGVPFHNSRNQLSFKFADTSQSDFTISQNSDYHIIIDGSLLETPASAWIGLKPNPDTSSRQYHQSWNWVPDWQGIFGTNMRATDSIFNFAANHQSRYQQMNAVSSSALFLTGGTASGVIDKAGHIMDAEEMRALFKSDNSIHEKLTKICVSNVENTDLWTHQSLILRGTEQDWPSSCSASKTDGGETLNKLKDNIAFDVGEADTSSLETLTEYNLGSFAKGMRSIDVILKFYNSGSYHVQNEGKFCDLWKAEKLRRAKGQCIVKAYNSTTDSNALILNGIKHSKKITQAVRKNRNICHKNMELCGGAFNYYQQLLTKTNDAIANRNLFINKVNELKAHDAFENKHCSTHTDSVRRASQDAVNLNDRKIALQTLINKGAATVKQECINAVNAIRLNQEYDPISGQAVDSGADKYQYSFDSASDSRCWSIGQLNPKASLVYKYRNGNLHVTGEIGVTRTENDARWDWDEKASFISTSLYSLRENVFVDLPDIGDDDLCDDDEVPGTSVNYTNFISNSSNCEVTTSIVRTPGTITPGGSLIFDGLPTEPSQCTICPGTNIFGRKPDDDYPDFNCGSCTSRNTQFCWVNCRRIGNEPSNSVCGVRYRSTNIEAQCPYASPTLQQECDTWKAENRNCTYTCRCGSGQIVVNNRCVARCTGGQERIDGNCVARCAGGQERIGNRCECPSNQSIAYPSGHAQCADNCRGGRLRRLNRTTCQCPWNQKAVNGTCTTCAPNDGDTRCEAQRAFETKRQQ